MAVQIQLFKFSKKLNSTKTPSNSDTPDSYDCFFLDAQSIMNPVIRIEDTKGKGVTMFTYNYAYIATLGRYYFISNTVITDSNCIVYYLQVDVLGSFKTDFLNSNQYVLRSTNHYNDYLVDTMYPTVPMPIGYRFDASRHESNNISAYNNKTAEWSDIQFFHQDYYSGAILFGVTGSGGVSILHYVCSVLVFKAFINQVVTATPTGFSWGNLPTGVQAALSNFLQYITYVKWIPFFPLTDNLSSAETTIYLGSQSFSINAYLVNAGLSNQPLRFYMTVPEHPLTSTHKYYNFSPFREVNLFFLPIGNIPLDTTKLMRSNVDNATRVYVNMIVDLSSADAEWTITTSNNDNFTTQILGSGVTNIGVDLSMTEYHMSMEAALASGLTYFLSNGIKSMQTEAGGSQTHTSSSGATHGGHGGTISGGHGGSLLQKRGGVQPVSQSFGQMALNGMSDIAKDVYDAIGNIVNPLGDVFGNISDFIASSFGQATTTGHTGSFLMSLCTQPVIYCWFSKHADEDYNRFGRPYCDTTRLDNISGFCKCKNAYVDSYATTSPIKTEIDAINNSLNAGIYIE